MALDTSLSGSFTNAYNLANTAITKLSDIADNTTYTTFSDETGPSPAGSLNSYSAIITALNAETMSFGTLLDGVTVSFSGLESKPTFSTYTGQIWSETFWTNLKTALGIYTTSILNSTDVDALVTALTSETDKLQVALYAADLERKQQVLRDLYSAASAATGAKGFTMPNMYTISKQLDAQQKHQFDLSQVSRDLIKIVFEWAKSNYQFTLGKGIDAHNADVEFNIRYAQTLLDSFKTSLSSIVEQHKLKLENALSQTETLYKQYTLLLERYKTRVGIMNKEDENNIAVLAERIKEGVANNKTWVEAETSQALAKINAISGTASAAASLANAVPQIILGSQTLGGA